VANIETVSKPEKERPNLSLKLIKKAGTLCDIQKQHRELTFVYSTHH